MAVSYRQQNLAQAATEFKFFSPPHLSGKVGTTQTAAIEKENTFGALNLNLSCICKNISECSCDHACSMLRNSHVSKGLNV